MKKTLLILIYFVLFFSALLFFTPKEEIYYYAETQLKPLGVIIGGEEVVDHGFDLEIQHATLYVKKIESATVNSIVLGIYGLYNHLHIEKITLDKTAEQFFPRNIEHINVHQSIFSPLQLHAESVGDFGEAEANLNILDRNGTLILKASKLMRSRYRNTLRQLKKSKDGDYYYEFKF